MILESMNKREYKPKSLNEPIIFITPSFNELTDAPGDVAYKKDEKKKKIIEYFEGALDQYNLARAACIRDSDQAGTILPASSSK